MQHHHRATRSPPYSNTSPILSTVSSSSSSSVVLPFRFAVSSQPSRAWAVDNVIYTGRVINVLGDRRFKKAIGNRRQRRATVSPPPAGCCYCRMTNYRAQDRYPGFFFAFLLAREGIAVWCSSLPVLNDFGKRYCHVAFYHVFNINLTLLEKIVASQLTRWLINYKLDFVTNKNLVIKIDRTVTFVRTKN